MLYELQKTNLVILVNFSCQALLILTRHYVKHYDSYNKECCFSLSNILTHFMTFDYLEN